MADSPDSPQRKKGQHYNRRAPKNWPERFLEVLAQTANVWASARAAGCDRKTPYLKRYRDPAFREAWDNALEDSYDALELAVRKRAQTGTEKPIFEKRRNPDGSFTMVQIDTVHMYHDTLAIFLLKAYRPEKFRDNFDYGKLIDEYEASKSRSETDEKPKGRPRKSPGKPKDGD